MGKDEWENEFKKECKMNKGFTARKEEEINEWIYFSCSQSSRMTEELNARMSE